MCHLGNKECLDTTDRPHGCPTLVPPRTDEEVLAAAVKWITEGAEDGLGTTLSGRMCEVIAAALSPRPRASDAERLRAVMRGLAIADAEAHESITLGREDVRVLCIALRLVSLVEGRAILYEVARHNPTFSQRVARERAAGRGGPGRAS